ncbi:SDR family NAD(P)-dependent oxidoreductase [Agromyces flavus]|uniref:SDR family NAD(P)-dependent oxidoreductase n=1 Tax=Agromyces flavus TaxID=589382 RepID=UPI0036109A2A
MKITEPLDLHIADKIFQLQSAALARPASADIPDLAGKTVVVLGGSYGIGASIADLAERSGAAVHSFGRSTTGTDVTDRRAIRRALARAASAGGSTTSSSPPGCSPSHHSPRPSGRRFDRRSRSNLLAPAQIAQEAYRYLRDSRGHLPFFTSSSYTRGRAGYSLYSATKAGVVNLTQALADEWSEHGVRVNCINPQRTRTPMRTNAFGEEPAHTLLDPEDVAAVSLKVLEADVTGQIVDVRVAS